MAAEGNLQLTDEKIAVLATAISVENMTSIAEGYMNISDETIKNLEYENRGKAQAFNREVLKLWRNKNSASDQVKVIHSLWYFRIIIGGGTIGMIVQ